MTGRTKCRVSVGSIAGRNQLDGSVSSSVESSLAIRAHSSGGLVSSWLTAKWTSASAGHLGSLLRCAQEVGRALWYR